MNAPWDIDTVKIRVTKHFALKYLSRWDWDTYILKEAIKTAYNTEKIGKEKYEIYISKSGFKKVITVFYSTENELLCISGSEGGNKK